MARERDKARQDLEKATEEPEFVKKTDEPHSALEQLTEEVRWWSLAGVRGQGGWTCAAAS